MTIVRKLFPHPILSAMLVALWLLLMDSTHPGVLVLGVFQGVLLPWFTRVFWPDTVKIHGVKVLLRFIPLFLWDVVIANIGVAWLILNFRRKPRPAFVSIPLKLRNPYAIVTLMNVISLTPGTVSSQLSSDRRTLLVHSVDVADQHALVERIRKRYEKPIQEIFEC